MLKLVESCPHNKWFESCITTSCVQKLIKAMCKVQLNLVVIRSSNIEQSVEFYQLLGLSFDKQQHGTGLEHFASEVGYATFEIYPCTAGTIPTMSTRLGFQVSSVDTVVCELQKCGASIVSPPADSDWGRRAVVADPDGHRVELTQIQ
jgi:lactoylglutathione lyase